MSHLDSDTIHALNTIASNPVQMDMLSKALSSAYVRRDLLIPSNVRHYLLT